MNATRTRHTLDERLAAARADLTPAEEKVAAFVAEHREEVLFLSAADIAQRLETSDASVIRAVQSLGYQGLPALKEELREAFRTKATPTLRLGRSLEDLGDDPEAILEHILAAELELMTAARGSLNPADFGRAVALLAGAERVVIQGVGPNAPLADYFALRLNRLRRPAVAIGARGLGLADALLSLREGDVLVPIAYERGTVETEAILETARELRLPTVLITDNLGLAMSGRVTVALSARRAGGGMFHLSSITIVVIDALLLGVAGRDRASALRSIEELQRLRARVEAAG